MAHINEALLSEMTNNLVQTFQPEQVILFGSYAWGTPHAVHLPKNRRVRFIHTNTDVIKTSKPPRGSSMISIQIKAHAGENAIDLVRSAIAAEVSRLELGKP